MKEYARMPDVYMHAYAQPQTIQSILNEDLDLESVPPAVIARGIELWPTFLSDTHATCSLRNPRLA